MWNMERIPYKNIKNVKKKIRLLDDIIKKSINS